MKTRVAGTGASAAVLILLTGASGALATEAVIHSFGDVASDGVNPQSELIADAAGNLYGTTLYGGMNGSCCGTVFELTPAGNNVWNETILYAFQGGTDGESPNGGLAIDKNGKSLRHDRGRRRQWPGDGVRTRGRHPARDRAVQLLSPDELP